MKNQALVTLAMVCVNIRECTLEHCAKHCELTLANHYSNIEWFHQWYITSWWSFLVLEPSPLCVS